MHICNHKSLENACMITRCLNRLKGIVVTLSFLITLKFVAQLTVCSKYELVTAFEVLDRYACFLSWKQLGQCLISYYDHIPSGILLSSIPFL